MLEENVRLRSSARPRTPTTPTSPLPAITEPVVNSREDEGSEAGLAEEPADIYAQVDMSKVGVSHQDW